VKRSIPLQWILLFVILISFFNPTIAVHASQPQSRQALATNVSAYDLIIAMNTLRVSNGLPALIEDPIIDSVAQATAEYMAANLLSWHIGNVSGRLQAAGYGGGAKVWATENFATGSPGYFDSIDKIMLVWSDASHMIPAVVPAYCNIGAGVATASNGMTYYVLQAAYTSAKYCGEYKSVVPTSANGGTSAPPIVPQIIVPVKVATPDADGRIYHTVQTGQTLWAIAIAYKVTINDLRIWNNMSPSSPLLVGKKLFIPSSNTAGYSTPTPVGMVVTSTPDTDGKIIHIVAAYQTLIKIAEAYSVKVDTILNLNKLQVDWPLQIGQKLLIYPGNVTPSPTPRPLTPIEKLTPASDGKYYHVVRSGETLVWIANLYNVKLNDLLAWNDLSMTSVIQPNQKLLLQVTPPATATYTPGPPTFTPTDTLTPRPSYTPTISPTLPISTPTSTLTPDPASGFNTNQWMGIIAFAVPVFVVGLIFFFYNSRKKR
jgi:LysM repeat protein/uncharacterized protein YkwD